MWVLVIGVVNASPVLAVVWWCHVERENQCFEPWNFAFATAGDTSCIEKRHAFVTEEVVKEYPEFASYSDKSLTTRLNMANKVVPEIAVEAAMNAVQEWGRPLSDITHMVVATTSTLSIPGTDFVIARKLGLKPSVQRIFKNQVGCWGGGAVMRVGRILAESAKNARVLVIAAEANTIMNFRKPTEETFYKVDYFLAHVTLGDGAAALILGADPKLNHERPLYEMYWSSQTAIEGSAEAIVGTFSDAGLVQSLQKNVVPDILGKHLKGLVSEGMELIGSPSPTDMFWVVHPGAYRILEVVSETMDIKKEKLQPSWDILRDFGNISSPTCLFVLDEMRKYSKRTGAATTGEGCEWGFLVGLGPGFNVELTLLRSVPF